MPRCRRCDVTTDGTELQRAPADDADLRLRHRRLLGLDRAGHVTLLGASCDGS